MNSQELHTCYGSIFAKTKKALGFRLYSSEQAHWIPLSQVHSYTYKFVGQDELVLKAWLAKRLGFI